MGLGMTIIIIIIFQARNVSKLPSDMWLERDRVKIQKSDSKPGLLNSLPSSLFKALQGSPQQEASPGHQGGTHPAVPSALTALSQPALGSTYEYSSDLKKLTGI